MPGLQLRYFVLLYSAYLLPFVTAECSFYLGEDRQHPTPEPGKCWGCPDAREGFGISSSQYPVSASNYDIFRCKYTRGEGKDENEKPYKASTLLCDYNDEKGELVANSDSRCVSPAKPIKGCTPVRPASGPVEFCCDPNCKLVTDQCWTCPKLWETIKVNRDWVDITVSRNLLVCTYQLTGYGMNNEKRDILFDAQTGAPVKGESGNLPFEQKAEFRPAQECTPKPVRPEITQDDYRTFRGNLRCPSRAEYCKRRSVSDDCWICPKIKGYDAVIEHGTSPDFTTCQYYKRNASGSLEKIELKCNYNIKEGKRDGDNNNCPAVPEKDAECMRLKGSAGNQK